MALEITKVNQITGEVVKITTSPIQMKSYFVTMQIKSNGEVINDIPLFVPNQAMEIGEILARSARGMDIPIVTREGVYVSKSIDDEIDVLDKMDKDLTDYTKALLKHRHKLEQMEKEKQVKEKKKEELYQDWVKSLNIKQDKTQSVE